MANVGAESESGPVGAPLTGLIFGAGSIGRGFIGQLLSDASWNVTFVDADEGLVQRLADDGCYTHVTVDGDTSIRRKIAPISAILASDSVAVSAAIESADLIFTCVGARALPAVLKALAAGIRSRIANQRGPVDIFFAENLHDVSLIARSALSSELSEIDSRALDSAVGLVETSIGRMVPTVDPEARVADPTVVLVEPYCLLPFDIAACRSQHIFVPGLVSDPDVPFSFYVERKLYVHNMGHFLCGLFAEDFGLVGISEAIRQPLIREVVRGAMRESCVALASSYGASISSLEEHIDDLISRFDNPALGDTVERVIRDLQRKMAMDDRMVGAYLASLRAGSAGKFLSFGVAVGIKRLAAESDWSAEECDIFVERIFGQANLADYEEHRARLRQQVSELLAGELGLRAQMLLLIDGESSRDR